MAFTLQLQDEQQTFDDTTTYRFNDAGLLVIRQADNSRRTYSPHAWKWIEDTIPAGRGPRRSERDDVG